MDAGFPPSSFVLPCPLAAKQESHPAREQAEREGTKRSKRDCLLPAALQPISAAGRGQANRDVLMSSLGRTELRHWSNLSHRKLLGRAAPSGARDCS